MANDNAVTVENPECTPCVNDAAASKAKTLSIVAILLCTVALVVQIVSASSSSVDPWGSLLYGTKTVQWVSSGRARFGMVDRSWSQWEMCEEPKSSNIPGVSSGCKDAEDNDCEAMDRRIKVVQAAGILGVLFTGIAWVPTLLGATGNRNLMWNKVALVCTVLGMIFSLVLWSVVAHLRYSKTYFCDKSIIDVDEMEFGDAFALVCAAWVMLFLQMVLLIVVNKLLTPCAAAKDVEMPPAATSTEPTGSA